MFAISYKHFNSFEEFCFQRVFNFTHLMPMIVNLIESQFATFL